MSDPAPLDLDALDREGEAFSFIHDGKTYTLPTDLTIETANLFDEEGIAAALEAILGEEQWQRLEASPKVFGIVKATRVIHAYVQHLGLESLGGSLASTSSSAPTVRR